MGYDRGRRRGRDKRDGFGEDSFDPFGGGGDFFPHATILVSKIGLAAVAAGLAMIAALAAVIDSAAADAAQAAAVAVSAVCPPRLSAPAREL